MSRGRGKLLAAVSAAVLALTLGFGASANSVALGSPESGRGGGAKAVDPDDLTWTRSPGGAPGAGNLNALATDGKVFVAGGLVRDAPAGAVPLWTSTDGLAWKPAKGKPADFPAGTIVVDLVHDGKRFLAFGNVQNTDSTLAWSSTDGRTWKSYDPKGFPVTTSDYPVAATRTKRGLVLLVRDENADVHSLWSARGDRWESLGPAGLGVTDSYLLTVGSTRSGREYVIAGGSGRDAAVWTSPDGSAWSPAVVDGLDPAAFESINNVVAAGPGLVATGVANDPTGSEIAFAWSSSDGARWVPANVEDFLTDGQGGSGIDTASLNGKSVLAAGHDGAALALWASADGESWNRVPDDPEFQVRNGTVAGATGVAAAKGRVVVVFRERRFNNGRFELVGLGIVSGSAR